MIDEFSDKIGMAPKTVREEKSIAPSHTIALAGYSTQCHHLVLMREFPPIKSI